MLTALLHLIAVVLAITVPWHPPQPDARYVILPPLAYGDTLIYLPGARDTAARGPTVRSPRRAAEAPPTPAAPLPAVPAPLDTGVPMPAYDPAAAGVAPAPAVGDGRLWVSPRPPLPAAVAEALYGDTTGRHAIAVARLRVMVDSLNRIIDEVQRQGRRPSWTIGGDDGGLPKFGIDSQYIHVAGIKIPTLALALLGNLLPAGNYDESIRARQLDDMRADLLRAADRAQSFQDFRRYVRELRARKQAERDAERARREQLRADTVQVIP